MRTIIIQHATSGDTFTALVNDQEEIVALSEPMYYQHAEAGDAYQDVVTLDEPIAMDNYRVVNAHPSI